MVPEIVDCACGHDHATVPTDDGAELVCRVHKRHIPCRRCESGAVAEIVAWAKSEQDRLMTDLQQYGYPRDGEDG